MQRSEAGLSRNSNCSRVLCAAIAGTLAVSLQSWSQAGTTWDGGSNVDGNWSTGANWDGTGDGVAPGAGSSGISFSANTNGFVSFNDYPLTGSTPRTVTSFTFNAALGSTAMTVAGKDIVLSGTTTNSSSALQTINLNMSIAAARTLNAGLADLKLGGNISGLGGLFVNGSDFTVLGTSTDIDAMTTLTGNNTYTGITELRNNGLVLRHVNGSGNAITGESALPGGTQGGNAAGVGSGLVFSIANGAASVLGLGESDFTREMVPTANVDSNSFVINSFNGSGQTGAYGWAAYGANRNVNVGGAKRALTMGDAASGYFTYNGGNNGSTRLILGSADSTHMVDFQNDIVLNGSSSAATRVIEVYDGTGANAVVDGRLSGKLTELASGNTSGITKQGPGTLEITNADNTYDGLTLVRGGTLLLNGTHNATGNVPAALYSVTPDSTIVGGTSATLGGEGTINVVSAVNSSVVLGTGGKLAPGKLPGVVGALKMDLNVGKLNLIATSDAGTGELVFDLAAPTASDKVDLTLDSGTYLEIAAATGDNTSLDFSDFAFTALSGFADGTYVLVDANKPIVGGLSTGAGLLTGSIPYADGTASGTLSLADNGNDLVLTVSGVVPEPTSLAAFAAGGLMLLRRRRMA